MMANWSIWIKSVQIHKKLLATVLPLIKTFKLLLYCYLPVQMILRVQVMDIQHKLSSIWWSIEFQTLALSSRANKSVLVLILVPILLIQYCKIIFWRDQVIITCGLDTLMVIQQACRLLNSLLLQLQDTTHSLLDGFLIRTIPINA